MSKLNRTIMTAFLVGILSSALGGTGAIVASNTYMAATERTEKLFVYGTLLNPVARVYACKCWVGTEPAVLEGYAKTYRDIIPSKTGRVRGAIVRVTQKELARIDRYERVPVDYVRERVVVDNEGVWAYKKTASARE